MDELTEIELHWLGEFKRHMAKKPRALSLKIDTLKDYGYVEVFAPAGKQFTPAQARWNATLEKLVSAFPDTPKFWLLSNIDGWHVGKGYPTITSGTGITPSGAMGTYSDNYHEHYVETFDVEFGELTDEERYECESLEIKSSRGDLRTWESSIFGSRLI